MSNWVDKDFEEKMTPLIDQFYKKYYANKIKTIIRSNRGSQLDEKLKFMDVNLAIDTHLTFYDGSILTYQEKSRRRKAYRSIEDFTFEYYNDPITKEIGEWFKLASQMYFYGIANIIEDDYEKIYILNVPKLRSELLKNFTIEYLESNYLRYNKYPAKSNFFAIPFKVLKKLSNVIIYESNIKLED